MTSLLLLPASVRGEVFSYECNSLPEDSGWELSALNCEPKIWVDDGWLLESVEVGCGGPPGGDSITFLRSLADFEGKEEFFIEWRCQSDGDSSELGGSAPAKMAAGGLFGVHYNVTISKDLAYVWRDNTLPSFFVEIEEGIPHTYRIELYGEDLYIWFIDGEVIDSGKPEGAYPTNDSNLSWRAKSWFLPSTTEWDYIRYGTIPKPGSGDFDSDDDVDLDDYYFFQDCVTEPNTDAGPGCVWADFDGDADVDLIDFAGFQSAFTGPTD